MTHPPKTIPTSRSIFKLMKQNWVEQLKSNNTIILTVIKYKVQKNCRTVFKNIYKALECI